VRVDRAGGNGASGHFAYVDEAHLHLVTADELTGWDPRRFRANVVVSGLANLDDLVGGRLRLGSVVVEVDKRTKRCAMPTMPQPGIDKDVGVLRTLARDRDLRLGVYAHVVSPGRLDVDAAITIA
ncbi:MAG TPA: MOSC domain-containing protein, partial [Nocardioidaceae bacterium]|nr:MOSC domain-containing protein [Nocardioidaceae bacterium]